MCKMNKPIFFLLATFALMNRITDGAKILAIFSVPSYSHQIVFQSVWQALVERGHEVTVLTPNVVQNYTAPNLRQIDLSFAYKMLHALLNLSDTRPISWRDAISGQLDVVSDVDEAELKTKEVQNIIRNKNETFDLVLAEWMTPTMLAFGAKYKCPTIAISTLGAYNTMYDAMGNPSHPVLHPEYFTGLSGQLTFWERLESVSFAVWNRWYHHYVLQPKVDAIVRKHIDKNLPPMYDIERNLSMMFLNVNPLLISPKPNLPTIVEFSGAHIRSKKPLPKDIKEFLDGAKEGAIYLSLGTNVKSSLLPTKLKNTIINAVSELPYKVLWKYEDEKMPNKPDNVFIKKWIPQQDVLGHKNVKVFIMQGGLQSLEEAIHNEMPIVGIPVISDQPRNIRRVTQLEIGRGIDPKTVTKDELKEAIMEVAENQKYRQNMKKYSIRLKDQPMNAVEKIIWWTEYVIRHKGAYHLRSPYADISWFKYLLLDVVAFLIFVSVIGIYLLIKIVKYINFILSTKIKIKIQ